MIATITVITEKKKYSDHRLVIIVIIRKPLSSDRSNRSDTDRVIGFFLSQRSLSLRTLESSFHVIAAITELFFFSAITVITAIVANIWKPGFE